VRSAIAEWLAGTTGCHAQDATDVALAVHPWPDVPLGAEDLRDLIPEIFPRTNLRHHDIREIAADRLLRFAEVMRHSHPDSSDPGGFEVASWRLVEMPDSGFPGISPVAELAVLDPTGVSGCEEASNLHSENSQEDSDSVQEPRIDLVSSLVLSVITTGSLDLGVNLRQGENGLSLADFLPTTHFSDLIASVSEQLETFDNRTLYILLHRILLTDLSKTLDDCATHWGITRERVRQLETGAKDRLRMNRDLEWAGMAMKSVRQFVFPTERFENALGFLCSDCDQPEIVAGALVWISGPWATHAGFTFHEDLKSRIEEIRATIHSNVDEVGILTLDPVQALADLMPNPEDAPRICQSILGLFQFADTWSLKDTLRMRVSYALRAIGRPATKEEILHRGDMESSVSLTHTLSELESVVRTGKDTWGLAEWGCDTYEGIHAEIRQKIEECGGTIPVAILMEELPRRYGVSPISVEGYLSTSSFSVMDGYARLADPTDFVGGSPSKWSDAVRVGILWGQKLTVLDRHLVGNSFKVRWDIAYANGLRSGCRLQVPINGTDSTASLIWRPSDVAHGIDVGRVRETMLELGIEAGDTVVICPSPDAVMLHVDGTEEQVLDPTTGNVDPSMEDPLLDLLGDQ
jgi:hypothetical protein